MSERRRRATLTDYEFAKINLYEILCDGEWHSAETVRAYIRMNLINQATFRKARRELGVQTRNNGDGTWDWRLR